MINTDGLYGVTDGTKVIAKFVTPMNVRSITTSFHNDTLSLKRNSSKRSAQRWEITTHLEPLNSTANDLFVLFCMNDIHTKYDLIIPQNIGVIRNRTVASGVYIAPIATGVANSDTIAITSSHYIPKGTFIKFSNHTKIYMICDNVNGDDASIKILPTLQTSLTNAAFAWRDDVVMKGWLDTSTAVGMQFEDGVLMDNGEVKFVEAL